jgi:hypothetical protein
MIAIISTARVRGQRTAEHRSQDFLDHTRFHVRKENRQTVAPCLHSGSGLTGETRFYFSFRSIFCQSDKTLRNQEVL